MNWLKVLVGLSAIIIAGCAAYFSVTGLGVLFAGASVSVMVMAASLELAKLVAATYLKQKWDSVGGFNKWYLTISVGVLMLITSAGIFGYLSNAFQAQSLQLQQIDREIEVHQTKIEQNTAQITQLSTQITEFNSNQGKIIDGGTVNSRLLRSLDARDKEISKINDKISILQADNAAETEKINEIKISNLDLEKEVGGFRFVAEAFDVELNQVVKFFIFLIVVVFDPLAVALIIAFNGLISDKKEKKYKVHDNLDDLMETNYKHYDVYGDKEKQRELLKEITQADEKDGLYDDWDVTLNDGLEDESTINENIVETNNTKEEELPNLKWEEYMHPEFPWSNRKLWINNPKAVNYWLNNKKGTVRELAKIRSEEENVKTY